MTSQVDVPETFYEAPIEAEKSVVADFSDEEPVRVSLEAVQVIEANNVKMHQSAAFSVLADVVEMRDSAGFIVRADEVRADNSVTFILAAGEVKGNITTLFTPMTAMILGGAIMLGMFLLRPPGRKR
ncbi:MAG: hypothetical protein NTY09_07820 [bacterium]|nr:hypothetical protein [bacterium]